MFDYLFCPKPPNEPFSDAFLESARLWLRTELSVPSIEQKDDLWYLFSSHEAKNVASRRLQSSSEPLYSVAVIRLRSNVIQLCSALDPATDHALYSFVIWALQQTNAELWDGTKILPEDLIDPEQYE